MNPRCVGRLSLAALALSAAVVVSGCGGTSRAYAPGTSEARQALELSLATWQQGGKLDALASRKPPVHPIDFQWQSGSVLESFQVVADEKPEADDPAQRFAVSLKLAKSKVETSARYVVVGRDPIWVYRQEDYARFLNMEDNPRPTVKRARK